MYLILWVNVESWRKLGDVLEDSTWKGERC